jgi:hypothetical protein
MDEKILGSWLYQKTWELYPPGVESAIVESPMLKEVMSCRIGLVHGHRFAFYFWSKFDLDYSKAAVSCKDTKPLLVSIDFHDDVGVESSLKKAELEALNRSSDAELGFYCWLRLPQLNDGQILPALYLNYFSDAFILHKQDSGSWRDVKTVDQLGREHSIRYFREAESLVEAVESAESQPIYLDVDLDYFVSKSSSDRIGAGQLVPENEIRKTLKLTRNPMSSIYPRLVGLTIAIEPRYCGGLKNSLFTLGILNDEFFGGTLLTDDTRWNRQY